MAIVKMTLKPVMHAGPEATVQEVQQTWAADPTGPSGTAWDAEPLSSRADGVTAKARDSAGRRVHVQAAPRRSNPVTFVC